MGAGVALHLTIRHPEVVRKLVFASASYTLSGVHAGLMEGLGEMKPEMMPGSPWHEEYMRCIPRRSAHSDDSAVPRRTDARGKVIFVWGAEWV
jgi:pimeloyl-ACP methyl ester carboxylesterase